MQNDYDYCQDDSLTSWLCRKEEIYTPIDEIKIHIPSSDDFFILYSEKVRPGGGNILKINFNNSKIFISIEYREHQNLIDKDNSITQYLNDHGNSTFVSNNNYIYELTNSWGNLRLGTTTSYIIIISKNTDDDFIDDDLQCLSFIEVKGTESILFVGNEDKYVMT
jgi:hypothetical protein